MPKPRIDHMAFRAYLQLVDTQWTLFANHIQYEKSWYVTLTFRTRMQNFMYLIYLYDFIHSIVPDGQKYSLKIYSVKCARWANSKIWQIVGDVLALNPVYLQPLVYPGPGNGILIVGGVPVSCVGGPQIWLNLKIWNIWNNNWNICVCHRGQYTPI